MAPTMATSWCTDAFLREIPKADLHVHLDGSLRLETLVELMRDTSLSLPTEDLDELRRTTFKKDYDSLEEYLKPFMYTCAVLQNAPNLERASYEFAVDNYAEGVRYFEVRFAPQLLSSPRPEDNFSIVDVLRTVAAGLARAQGEFDAKRSPGEPRYDFGIVSCAMRMFFPQMSRYYDALHAVHPHADARALTCMASTEMVRACVAARDESGVPVVAIDVAGAEKDNEAEVHRDAFALAHAHGFAKTVHAGEGYGPESIWQAVRVLHAERIGHGFHLFSSDLVMNERNRASPQAYVDRLVKYVSDRRITMEVCLTSNLNTMPELTLERHALREMVSKRISVSIGTDNRLVSDTDVCRELRLAVDSCNLSPKQLKDIVITGFKRSFYHGPYTERRIYVRELMDFYDAVAAKHGVPHVSG